MNPKQEKRFWSADQKRFVYSLTPSHMCEGVFLFLQLFKLTTSNWFGHTVRAQRAHEVRGTSALSRPKRSGDPRGPGDLGLDRPKRSGDPRGPGDLGLDRPERSGDRKFESCLSQCIELTSSSWLKHIVRVQTVNSPQSP